MPIAIEVARTGHPLFYFAAPGAMPDNGHWIRRKRNIVERFYRSSLLMKRLADREGRPLLERYVLSADDHISSGGSVPIAARDVGSVTLSGLTQYDDHRLAAEAIWHVVSRR